MTDTVTWEDLPPPTDLGGGPEGTQDTDAPICPTCGEPILKDPTWKRMHKYHDGCQPTGNTKGGERRVRTGGKAEKEADRCEQILRGFFIKTALAVSVVDRYDAFCIMVNTPAVCSAFRGVCLRYEDVRKQFLTVPEEGSIVGLVFAVAFMVVPMAAHHGLVPSKRIAEIMANIPLTMYRFQKRMAEGEAGLSSMMDDYLREMRKQREQTAETARAKAAENGQYVGPS